MRQPFIARVEIGYLLAQLEGNRCDEAMAGLQSMFSGVEQEEAAGAIRVLGFPFYA